MKLSNKVVSVFPCHTYDHQLVKKAVEEVIKDCGGIDSFVKEGQKVLIKPNMLAPERPDRAVTTHPIVVKAVIEIIKEAGGIPYVGDNPMEGSLEKVAKICGIEKVVKETGATLISLERNRIVQPDNTSHCNVLYLSDEALKMDVIINLPKLKTHTLTGITAAVKNNYGLIGGWRKKYYHVRYPLINEFGHLLLDIYLSASPTLSILDAVLAMEGLGPRSGRPKPAGAILASTDAISLDAVAARMIGYHIPAVSSLFAAVERQLIKDDLSDITVLGPINQIVIKDFNKGVKDQSLSFLWKYIPAWFKGLQEQKRPWPYITTTCIRCEKCIEHCPILAIKKSNNGQRIEIDYKKCVRCYCCQEACAHGSVSLKKGKYMFSRIAKS